MADEMPTKAQTEAQDRAVVGEPVAWRYRPLGGTWWQLTDDKPVMHATRYEVQPLYLAPQAPNVGEEDFEAGRKVGRCEGLSDNDRVVIALEELDSHDMYEESEKLSKRSGVSRPSVTTAPAEGARPTPSPGMNTSLPDDRPEARAVDWTVVEAISDLKRPEARQEASAPGDLTELCRCGHARLWHEGAGGKPVVCDYDTCRCDTFRPPDLAAPGGGVTDHPGWDDPATCSGRPNAPPEAASADHPGAERKHEEGPYSECVCGHNSGSHRVKPGDKCVVADCGCEVFRLAPFYDAAPPEPAPDTDIQKSTVSAPDLWLRILESVNARPLPIEAEFVRGPVGKAVDEIRRLRHENARLAAESETTAREAFEQGWWAINAGPGLRDRPHAKDFTAWWAARRGEGR